MRQTRYLVLTLLSMVYANRSTAHYCDKFVLELSTNEQIEIYKSQDAGAYYCEHAFCIGVKHADTSPEVGTDANGNKLVGFMHIAPDKHLFSETGSYSLAERHHKTRAITAAAVKSYFASLVNRFPTQQQFKLLLTGYNRFSVSDINGTMLEITNNPSQDFVKNHENIDSVMELAFGNNQVKAFANADEQNYVINTDGRSLLLTIKQSVLPVDDDALNINLPQVLNSFKPNAIISTGLGGHYTSEIRASDKGLEIIDGRNVHDSNSPVTFESTNLSLWNAILNGSKK